MEASRRIGEALVTTAWSLWTELGVAGVERHHRDCSVDPEALLLFTSTLAERDRRLRDESLDCALAIAPYLFVSRLKLLLAAAPAPVQASFSPWAATFNQLTKSYVRLPTKRAAKPWQLSPSGKSARGGFERAGQILLRCRSIFGVAARADVVTALVCTPRSGWTAAELAARVHLAKRVIANVLLDLERGGILHSTAIGNRLCYDLVERNRLMDLVGLTPRRMPAWSSILPFMAEAARLVEDSPGRNQTALLVDAQHLIEGFLAGQARLGRVHDAPPFASWLEMSLWLADQLKLVASGRSPWLDVDMPTVAGPRACRRQS